MKHTPGPWEIRDDDEDGVISIVGRSRIVLARVRTATVEPGDENARLIASAPELLDALSGMVEMFKDAPTLEQFSYDEPPEPRSQWDYDAILMLGDARAVIAKARGES